ncbi:unnamed protein product, partial [Mesorhabditis spiculigera]
MNDTLIDYSQMVNYNVDGVTLDVFLPIYTDDMIVQGTRWYPLMLIFYCIQGVTFVTGFLIILVTQCYIHIYKINHRNAENLEKRKMSTKGFYSLSLRFQITENIKSLELLRAIVWTGSMMILTGLVIYSVPRLLIRPKASETIVGQMFNAILECAIDIFPNVVLTAAWVHVRKWGRFTVTDMPKPVKGASVTSSSLNIIFDDLSVTEKHTNIYFTQLQQSWA